MYHNIHPQVLLALDALRQKKIAHRDIKPENLALDSNGCCRMIDFGLAKICQEPTYTRACVGCALFIVIALFHLLIRHCPLPCLINSMRNSRLYSARSH